MLNAARQRNDPKLLPDVVEQTAFLKSSTTVHYIECEPSGGILYCSPAVGRPLRVAAERLAGTSIWDLMPDSDAANLKNRLEHCVEGRFRLNLWNADRGTFPLQCIAYVKADVITVIGEAVATFNEDQIQKRMAAELRRSNDDLEQFAYIASHDLQEPLRTVSGFAQMLQRKYRGRLDAQADEYIEFCVAGTKRLHDLISGLLTYSRVTRMGESRERVDLNEMVEEAVLLLGRAIKEAHAEVEYDLLPAVWGNRQQIFQVVENLINNALKFRGDRRPKIVVTAEASDGCWVIAIRDNGVGIESQYLERIFEPFQRLHGREYPGSGIGLALCRKIIERHGGSICAESEPGCGTVFRFTLEDAACAKQPTPIE